MYILCKYINLNAIPFLCVELSFVQFLSEEHGIEQEEKF